MTIGAPYFLLVDDEPADAGVVRPRAARRASPYRLFALSNLASMLALLGYPFLLEPWSPTRMQAIGWSLGYALFVGLCAAAGWTSVGRIAYTGRASARTMAPPVASGESAAPPTPPRGRLLWARWRPPDSLLLLAVTNHITQNIASVPLLWIVPLAIYLLTFILCFDAEGWYRPGLMRVLAAVALGAMAFTLADAEARASARPADRRIRRRLFLACMFCHGELARLKPAPRYLTRFYLMLSLGGAVGSVLVGIVAPLVLPGLFRARRRPCAVRAAAALAGPPRSFPSSGFSVPSRLSGRSERHIGNPSRSMTRRSARSAISTASCAYWNTTAATRTTIAR